MQCSLVLLLSFDVYAWKLTIIELSCKQGRLEPVQASVKNNKRGLGADKVKKKIKETKDNAASDRKNNQVKLLYIKFYAVLNRYYHSGNYGSLEFFF